MPVFGLFTLETSQIRLSRITLNRSWITPSSSTTPSGNKLLLPDEKTPLIRIPKDGKALHAKVELPLERTFSLVSYLLFSSHLPVTHSQLASSISPALSQARFPADHPPLRPHWSEHSHESGRLPSSRRRRASLLDGRCSGSRLRRPLFVKGRQHHPGRSRGGVHDRLKHSVSRDAERDGSFGTLRSCLPCRSCFSL